MAKNRYGSLLKATNAYQGADDRFVENFSYCSDCLNCLEPLLKSLHWQGTKRQIYEALPHYFDSLTIESFNKVMRELDFNVSSFHTNTSRLSKLLTPCLFVPNNGMAMIVLRIKDKQFTIFDGATCNIITLTNPQIEGTVHLYEKNPPMKERGPIKKNWVLGVVLQFKTLLAQIIGLSFANNILALLTPIFIMTVYDKVIGSGSLSMLIGLGIGILASLIGSFYISKIRAKILSHLSIRLDEMIGNKVYTHLLALPPSYIENATTAAQVSRIKDFDSLKEFFSGPLFGLLFEIPAITVYFVAIAILGGNIVIIPVLAAAVYLLTAVILHMTTNSMTLDAARSNSKRQEFLIETFGNIRLIKFSGNEETWAKRYRELSSESSYKSFKSSVMTEVINSLSDIIMICSGMLILATGVSAVIDQEMTVGALIAIMMIVWRTLAPLKMMFTAFIRIDQVGASIKQINNLMSIPSERKVNTIVNPLKGMKGDVSFIRVSLRYHADFDPALLGVSFDVKAGQLVTITGNNASGKSSILKLMLRLLTPQTGSIRIDGRDIRQIDHMVLRKTIGYLSDQTHFFYGTIEQNLKLVNPLATEDDIRDATSRAGIYDDIMALPEGFETRLKESEQSGLSASFQQRLSLARVYLNKNPILLLDEPFHSLDTEADEAFLKAIEYLRGSTTIFLITHRPSHLKMSDKILVFDEGLLAMSGVPSEVLPKLAKLWA